MGRDGYSSVCARADLGGRSIMQQICVHIFVNAVLISAGAAATYRGADNRLSGYAEERYRHERKPPDIEYHYPDVNQISPGVAALSPGVRYTTADDAVTSRRQPTHFVSHVARRKQTATSTAELHRSTQWGTARIPFRGAVVNVHPSVGRQRSYRGVVTTTVLSPDSLRQQNAAATYDTGFPVQDQPMMYDLPCYRCPSDKTVVAARASEFVLLEKPVLKPCHQRSWSPDVKLELMGGARPGSALHEGSHVLQGRIMYRGQTLQSCHYRYTVIVRRCPAHPATTGLHTACSAGNTWGSECRFTCGAGLAPLGPSTTTCGDNLRWSQPLPRCIPVAGCSMPPSPEHSRLSCNTADTELVDLMPEGATCRYVCSEGYHQSGSVDITCSNGEWNSTELPSCSRENSTARGRHPQRHRKHRLGPGRRDPCRPNPCEHGGQCVAGPNAALALCACPPDLNRDGQTCHNVVLIERLKTEGKKKRTKQTTVVGQIYAKKGSIIPGTVPL